MARTRRTTRTPRSLDPEVRPATRADGEPVRSGSGQGIVGGPDLSRMGVGVSGGIGMGISGGTPSSIPNPSINDFNGNVLAMNNGSDHRRRIRNHAPDSYNDLSVVREPFGSPGPPQNDFLFSFASLADDLPAWGTNIAGRDRELRRFWPTENLTASAMYSMAAKYASLEWTLDGPPRLVAMYQRMLNAVEFGEGWSSLISKHVQDLLGQDNGAFIELVRSDDHPAAPVITMNHLDANRCVRTGHRANPIIYYDNWGAGHLMKWYQVVIHAEYPSPIERMRGIQVCALSRLLRAAQTMRDLSIYKREKISGRFNRAVYFVSGVQQRSIDNMQINQRLQADADGLTHFMEPLIIASLDPGAAVKVDKIDIASLPDGFNEDENMRWYVAQMALAFGGDYQDFAPLPNNTNSGGGQSRMLHQKSLSKGSRLFIKLMEQTMNFRGIIPSLLKYTYAETDPQDDAMRADLKLTRAKERQIRILSGEVTPAVARQIAADDGDLDYAYMMQLNEEIVSDTVAVAAWDPFDADPDLVDVDDPTKYTGTPDDQAIPGALSTGMGMTNGGDTSNKSPKRTSANAGKTVKTEAKKLRGTSGD